MDNLGIDCTRFVYKRASALMKDVEYKYTLQYIYDFIKEWEHICNVLRRTKK